MSGFTVRVADAGDLAMMVEWAAAEGWNPGLADAACFRQQDREGFFVGVEDGKPVSCISVVNYGGGFAFLGFYIVLPEWRGRGHGLVTWKAALEHAGARTVGLDGVVAQQGNYRKSGFVLAHPNFRYGGRVAPGRMPKGVVPAASLDPAAIAAYDAACFPADRPAFLRAWTTQPGHLALGVVRDGRLAGYGVARPARDAVRIGPLFADDRAAAELLFDGLATAASGGPLCIDVPATNATAVAVVQERGLTAAFETARMYTGPIRPLAMDRVFGITTLELG